MSFTYHSVQGTRLDLLTTLPKKSVCAEIGVFRGDFSAEILSRCDPSQLFLVDLWKGNMWSGDRDGEGIETIDMEKEMWNVRARFRDIRVELVPAISWEWLAGIPKASLDWCYIDTDHTYETTKRELQAALNAVKPGGLICGHDFHTPYFPGVVLAVKELCEGRYKCEIWEGDKLPSYKISV